MNNFHARLFLLCACFANLTWAFLLHRAPAPSNSQRSTKGTHDAGKPLLLTPLIDAGELKEARERSRVSPVLDVESYAGFFTVNKTTKSHLYFWFIPKTTTANNRASPSPVILWLQGGPGCSSLFGLFAENGPFQVTQNNSVKRRVHAWTNDYNMLYIDQPVGTGFSFSDEDSYITTEKDVGEHLYAALVQFFILFSEFKDHDFYIAGESYGGKYVPAIGARIHAARQQQQQQQQQPDAYQIRLKGMMIGNGLSDPENMMEYAEFLHVNGMIDVHERQHLELIQDGIRYYVRSGNWSRASTSFSELLDYATRFAELVNIYDYTSNDSPDMGDSYVGFVTDDRFRKRIHVGNVEYQSCSPHVHYLFHSDIMQTARPTIEELLDHYPMLFYNGQFDIICAHWLTENYLDKLHWSGAMKYASARKRIWKVGNKVAGYYKSAANLVYTMVRNAGHMVPSDQPENTLDLINMFIGNKFQ